MARKIPRLETLEDRLNPSGLLDRYFNASETLGTFEQNRPQPSIVFIDESLIDRVPQEEFVESTVITINHQSDPIDQMTDALSGLSNVEVVRIISHGRDGTLIFGETLIGENQLRIHERQLYGWANALKPDGDILLYGCSVASTGFGEKFVTQLAQMTGGDVAASKNQTGAKGDILLEYSSGPVNHVLTASQQGWMATGVTLPQDGDYTYTLNGAGVTITGYSGPSGEIFIPNTIAGLPVTSIGSMSFQDKNNITKIFTPETITSIEEGAFRSCLNLTSITLFNQLTFIGDQAFASCEKLNNIILPNSLTAIGDAVFNNCRLLTSIILPDSLTSIGISSFAHCNRLENLILPQTVTFIGDGAFYSCGLYSIYAMGNAPNLGQNVFTNVPGTVFYQPRTTGWSNPWGGLKTEISEYNFIIKNWNVTITEYTGLSSDVTIPKTIAGIPVAEIGNESFINKYTVTNITIPDSVTLIGNHSFYNCHNIENFIMGSNIKTIGKSAFSGCDKIKNLILPNGVITIGEGAFSFCTSLSSITLPNSVITIGEGAFYNCTGLTSIALPGGINTIDRFTFSFCTSLSSITLPNSVTTIGDYAFEICGLTSITLPDSITSIGERAFRGCSTSLNSISLSASVAFIGIGAFSNCKGLTAIYVNSANTNYSSVDEILFNKDKTTVIVFPAGKTGAATLPLTVTNIGDWSFDGCTGLTSITLPNSVTTIASYAFRVCTGLTSITLPNSIKTIGDWAFYSCTGLTSIYAFGNAPTLGYGVFSGVPATLYYYRSATGFTNPWGGLATVARDVPTTTTTLASLPNPSVYGDNITLTTSVVASLGVATGTVTFKDGSTVLGTANLDGSGGALFTISTLAAGNHSLIAEYNGTTDFTTSVSAPLAFAVLTKSLTITANNKSKMYGNNLPAFTTTITGLVNGDTPSVINGLTLTTTALASSDVGTYPITPTGATSGNYAITLVNGTLTVTKAALTITADDKSKIYGDTLPTLTATYSGLVNGDTSTAISGLTLTTTALASSNVGTYPITPAGATSANYAISLVNGTLTVTKAALTVTADDKSKIYGDSLPTLTATYSGLVNGDTSAAISGLTLTTTAVASSNVGTYPITAANAASGNYAITLVNGTLTVTKAALTITTDDKSKIYGAALPTLTATYSGLVNGDTSTAISGLTLTTTALASSNVGTYLITPVGATSGNYSITLVNGTLTITKAALTITAEDKSKVYGVALPTLTATFSGLVNGDTSAAITGLTLTTTALASSNVGTYPITPAGATSGNYAITLVNGTLTVTKAALTITADDKSKVYGDNLPTLTASYTGLVNGDTSGAISGLTLTTTALASSNVGTYSITPAGATSGNYAITLVNGTLTVTKAALTITANDKSKVYGDALPTLTASYSGLVNGDTSAAISGLTLTTTALASSNVGTHPITTTGASSPNYDISLVGGNLAVIKAAITITADDKSKVYGDNLPTLTASYSGLVNGDTSSAISGLTLTTTALASSNVGTYPITATGATSGNYSINLANGTLTVTKAALTITADLKTKVYGQSMPQLTLVVSGLVNGDKRDQIANLGVGTAALASSPVGNYDLIPTGTNDNYKISYNNALILITRAPLTITGPNLAKVYGDPTPTLVPTVFGLVNGDTNANLSGLGAISQVLSGSSVGTYPVTVLGTNPNYDITKINGSILVTPAKISVRAEDKSFIRGLEPLPAFTYTLSGFVNGDNGTQISGAPILSSNAQQYSPFGNYPISVDVSKMSNPNYTFEGLAGTLSINKVATSIIPVESIPILTTTNGAANGITIWGAGGKKLGTLNPYPGYTGRIVTAVGDLNGDGVVDIITGVGAGTSPLLRRFDGRTLKEIGQGFYAYDKAFMGGMSVAAADVDGDGLFEIITGTGNGSAPHVKVRKMDGTITASFYAYAPEFTRGVNLITGDIDGDSKAEIVSTPNWGGGPHVKVFDGKGKASASFFAYESTFIGGFSLALADTDGNGTKEIVTESYAGRITSGRIFDPKGKMLREWFPHGTISSGGMVIAADLNGDKIDEIVSVALPGSPSILKVFGGGLKQTASTLPYGASYTNGISIKAVDLNADGIKEIVTAPRSGLVPQVRRFDGMLKVLDSLFATATSFTGGIWLD